MSLTPEILKEWVEGSAVDPQLVSLNVESLKGYQPFERLFYSDKIQRLNTGRLSGWILRRYAHVEHGGWWCSGIDPITGKDDLWGCLKPDHPRIDATKGKHQKYEHPLKAQATLFALKATDAIWQKVASRYSIEIQVSDIDESRADRGFWLWIINHPEIPLLLTEGAKKAACLLCQGFAAIGLPGIWGGYRKNDGKPALIPQLECFANKERKFYFAFDQDEKRQTRLSNRKALWATAKLLKAKGCESLIISWESWIKGVDDLIVTKGAKHFTACYKRALKFEDWQADRLKELTYPVALRLDSNTKYLGDFAPPPNAKLICLKAPKGSGKTEWLVKICEDAQKRGQKVLILTHRTQLGKALCERFGLDYIDELADSVTKGVFGYGLCFDSLRQNSKARFNPEDWQNCIVILDECEQSLWHLLNANTEVSKHRVQILRNFQQLIQTVLSSEEGRVYLSDADLSDVAIDYIKSLVSFPIDPWIVVKEGNPTPWNVTVWDNEREMLDTLISRIRRGEKALVFVDGAKTKSKWGTKNLEAYLHKEFPELKILRIDADSVVTPGHPAYGCIERLNEVLKEYDLVIASPTIETGVSIDLKGHFTSVWDLAQGVIPVPSVLQRMARLREPVPRHVWAKGYGLGRIANGSTSPNRLVEGQQNKFKAHIKQLTDADFIFDWESASNFQPQALKTWAKMAARINLGMVRYRHEIIRALVAEGHLCHEGDYLAEMEQDNEMKGTQLIKEELTETRDTQYQKERLAIAESATPESTRLESLKQKKVKTDPERWEQHKGELVEKYGSESLVSSELIELDDKGEYPKAQLHYYLSEGEEFLNEREKSRMERLLELGENELFLPDANRGMIGGKLAILKILGIPKLLEQGREWTNETQELIDLSIKTKQFKDFVKDVLGLSFNFDKTDKDGNLTPPSPVSIGQKYLRDCLGLKFSDPIKRGAKGSQQRFYQPVEVSELRTKLLVTWRQRDEQKRAAKLAEAAATAAATTVSNGGSADFVSTYDTVSSTGNINVYTVSPAYQNAAYQEERAAYQDPERVSGVSVELPTEGGSQVESQGVAEKLDPVGGLLEAFLCCTDLETFAAVTEHYSAETVEEAIALQPNPLRQQLAQWFEQLSQPESTAGFEGKNISQPSPEDALIQKAKRSGKAVYRYIGGILFRGGRSLTAGCLVESLGLDKFGLLMYVQKLGEVWENQKELMLSVDPKKLEPV
jgi:hypothetical protein